MSIYENPQEYANFCHISIKLATKRCNYFLNKLELANKVVCPECESTELEFDDDGSDYCVDRFISCTECWETFDINDERLKDWVRWEEEFDEILWFANDLKENGVEKVEREVGEKWEVFCKKSTDELFKN